MAESPLPGCYSVSLTARIPRRTLWHDLYSLVLWTEVVMVYQEFIELGASDSIKCCRCFSSVQLLSCIWLFVTPWSAACQYSLSFTISLSLLKLMSIESVMPSNHLILCHPLLLPPSIFPNIRVFPISQLFTSGGQSIGVSASASVLPMNIQDWFPLGWTGWISLQKSSTTPQMFTSEKQTLLRNRLSYQYNGGFPGSSDGKASAYNAGDLGSIPGLGRSPGEGNGNPLQYSCLENPMDGGAW